MAYTGWLSFGGNELLNTPRAVGISQSAACPAFWLKENWCLSLRAVLGDAPYVHENVRFAPWFDPANAEVSSRFYGAYGIDIEGLEDSTRQVQKTEGIRSGGVIGRTRKAMRPVRVRAVLLADGDDALEYGRAWLEAALDPGACGQHGGECGTADVEYFATCPPLRGIVDYFSPWSVAAENLFTNPNLIGSGSVEVYRNLFTNPSFEATSGTVEVRRNLHPRPIGVSNWGGWAGTGGVLSVTYPTEGSLRFARGTIVTSGAAGAFGVTSAVTPGIEGGKTYAFRIKGRTSASASTYVRFEIGWRNSSGSMINYESVPSEAFKGAGVWHELAGVFTAPAGAAQVGVNALFGSTSGAVVGDTYDSTQVLVEQTSVLAPYFDGSYSPDPDLTPSWVGAANASESVLTGRLVSGTSTAAGRVVIQSQQWAASGANSLRVAYAESPSQAAAGAIIKNFAAGDVGKTFTVLGTIRLDAVGSTEPHWDRKQRALYTYLGGGAITDFIEVSNAPGIYHVRYTFTLTSQYHTVRFGGSGGQSAWLDNYAVVEGVYNGPYFDGSTSNDPDLTPSWVGSPNASESVLKGVPVTSGGWYAAGNVTAIASTWDGLPALRVMNNGSPTGNRQLLSPPVSVGPDGITGVMSIGRKGPALLGSSSSGIQEGSSPYTSRSIFNSGNIPDVGTMATGRVHLPVTTTARLRFMAPTNEGEAFWYMMPGLFAGVYDGPWFAGDTENTELNRYSWAGAANASASIWESRVPLQRPQTDEEWAASIDDVRRFLHGVAATSGPFTLKEMRKGRHVGQLVEFTLTAERPWVHGVTRAVELPTTQTSVIEDVRYNLTPHPSMELSSGVVVLSRNLATNPSVETNDTGWSASAAASTGSAPSSFLTSGRSVELAAVGAASYRARLLGSGSPVASGRAQLEAQQVVQLGSLPARSRVSVRIWGALIQSAGGAGTSLVSLQMIAQWRTAGGADISSEYTPLATTALNGRAFELRGLLPPSNATQVRVILRATVDWVSSATPALNSDIRLYADALAVTTP